MTATPSASGRPVLIASDLDRTLIYSRAAIAEYGGEGLPVVPVERYLDADASFMTATAADLLSALLADRRVELVPTTTRTSEQLARVTLPGPPPRHAIAANGGVLLVDGVPDQGWDRHVARALTQVTPLDEVRTHVESVCRPEWTHKIRTAAGLFCYVVLDRAAVPAGFVAQESAWATEHGWQTSLQGRKLYWVPDPLTKSAALGEVVRRTGTPRVLAAGDSLLDADLLLAADAAVVARHGELVDSGWSAPGVTVTRAQGALAGEEIVRWFAGSVTV